MLLARLPAELLWLLWAKGALHRAISATHRLEVAVRFSSLPLAVSASLVVEGEDNSALSDYDVSMYSASQLFERVNLPETLPQYTSHKKKRKDTKTLTLTIVPGCPKRAWSFST